MLTRRGLHIGRNLAVERRPVDKVDQEDTELSGIRVNAAPTHPVRLPLFKSGVRDRFKELDGRNERRRKGDKG